MKAFELLSRVTPQLGVRTIDTNDISSIPEEVCSNILLWILAFIHVLFR